MTEIRALLLTDVVDSTRLSEQLGDRVMTEAWAAHDRAARDLLPRFRGREIDKTDGMLLLFDSAGDAVQYALHYQQALVRLPVALKARVGLHVGPVILRENHADDVARGAKPVEVDGLAKPTAARVMSLAQGGQILLTPQAREALGDTALTVHSHGHWLIKGLVEPIELFEVGGPDAPFVPPADSDKVYRVARSGGRWLPVRQMPNNLPQQLSSFVGRERELADVKALMGSARLVTLLGMGGLGKTRLSLQVAQEVMPEFPDGVWFLDLAPLRDPALVAPEAAQALGVREESDRPLLQTICAHLKPKRLLLIVDNCEHLLQASAEIVNAILGAAPDVHVITSSREALHVPGERAYAVLPLPLPASGATLEALSQSTAVRLFVERAQSHKASFKLSEREAPAVAELVARLEGIPLALELAAARVRSLSVGDINDRLKDRYKLLTGGGRVLLERQQTLRALVDWSYDLLNAHEQTALDRLGVFVGGFDLEAAEAVCGVDPLDRGDVLDLLASLVEKSLVMLDEREERSRYRMLETMRDYALAKLAQRGEAASAAQRHCEFYFALAKTTNRAMRGPDQAVVVARMETELDNVRTAIALALSGGVDPFIAVKFAVAMMNFWLLRGYATEGRAVVRDALALPAVQASDLAQAWALYTGAGLAGGQGDHIEARRMLETCLTLRRRLGNPLDIAATLSTLSMARLPAGDAAAARRSEQEALAVFRQHGDRINESIGLLHLGEIHLHIGDEAQATAYLQEALAIAREIGHHEVEGESELMLGVVAFESGDAARAQRHLQRSLEICRAAGDRRGEANAQRWLGKLHLQAGQFDRAHRHLHRVLQAYRAFEMREEVLGCLEDHAALFVRHGPAVPAVQLAATASAGRQRMGLRRSPGGERHWAALLHALRQAVPGGAFDSIWATGLSASVEEAAKLALSFAPPAEPEAQAEARAGADRP